jgi:hypothetical protein
MGTVGFALTLEETDESTATRREEIAPVILSTCSWVSVKPKSAKSTPRFIKKTYKDASSAKEHAMAKFPTVLRIIP